MYHVSAQSYNALTKVSFLILSSVILCAFHNDVNTNQNCSRYSLSTPLNTGNWIALVVVTLVDVL